MGSAQAMLYAIGLSEEDMHKPQVGISPVWWEGNPCNNHLLDLGKKIKESCEAEGIIGLMFNTIGVRCVLEFKQECCKRLTSDFPSSDGITMGTDGEPVYSYTILTFGSRSLGMRYSCVLRHVV